MKAIITGVYGQDGSYMAELLASKGYEVFGVVRKHLSDNSILIKKNLDVKNINIKLYDCNLNSFDSVAAMLKDIQPDEFYHFSAVHFSAENKESDDQDRNIFSANIAYSLNIIDSIKIFSKHTKLVQAGSCLMYDSSSISPQSEKLHYDSNSVYGLSKITASNLAKLYRENYKLHLSTALLYNHESPRRAIEFVSKKIVSNVCKIKNNQIDFFELGDITAIKDWGYAKDYVYAMWLMTQAEIPDDYIISTGIEHSVKDMLDIAFEEVGIRDWSKYVKQQQIISRKNNVLLIGENSKLKSRLGWEPSINFKELIKLMITNELNNKLD